MEKLRKLRRCGGHLDQLNVPSVTVFMTIKINYFPPDLAHARIYTTLLE